MRLCIAARLMVLGYPLPPGCEGLHSETDDLLLLSRDLDNASPWLDPADPVTPVHLLRCAKQTGRKPAEVAARLQAFGFTADASHLDGVELTPEDLIIASRDLEGSPPWLDPTRRPRPNTGRAELTLVPPLRAPDRRD